MGLRGRSALCLCTCVLANGYDAASWENASLEEILDWASVGQFLSTSGGALRSLQEIIAPHLKRLGLGMLADDIVDSLAAALGTLKPLLLGASSDMEGTARKVFEVIRPKFVTRMLGILEPQLKAEGLSSISYYVFKFLHEESLDMLRPVIDTATQPKVSLMLILEGIRPELIARMKNVLEQRSRKMEIGRDANEVISHVSSGSLSTLLPIIRVASVDEDAALRHTIESIRTKYIRAILGTLEWKMQSTGIDCLAATFFNQTSLTQLSTIARQCRLQPENALKLIQDETSPMLGKNLLCRLGVSIPSSLLLCMSLLLGLPGVVWLLRRE